jgi:hypothetical protein
MARVLRARAAGAVIVGVGILALILRLILVIDLTSTPESDEIGYLSDGLLLLEGLPPGYKHVPSAAITWLVALYAGLQTGVAWLFGTADPSMPPLLRPLAAMERVLFEHYADLGSLRLLIVGLQTALASLAAAGIAWLGNRIAGIRGALAGGLLAAALPLFVDYAAQTRAYSFAWSFALLSFVGVFAVASQWKAATGAIFIGLAIATRVEMALCLPVLLLEVAATEPRGRRLRAAAIFLGITIVCFWLAAPWYVTSLAGNLRQILDVRFLVVAAATTGPGEVVRSLVWSGLGLPLLVTILALAIGGLGRRTWRYVVYAAWLIILTTMALRQSGGGVRHDGALFVLVVATIPLAVSVLLGSGWNPLSRLTASAVVCLLAITAVSAGAYAAWQYRNEAVHGDAVRWLEAHVPAGTTVYLSDSFAVPPADGTVCRSAVDGSRATGRMARQIRPRRPTARPRTWPRAARHVGRSDAARACVATALVHSRRSAGKRATAPRHSHRWRGIAIRPFGRRRHRASVQGRRGICLERRANRSPRFAESGLALGGPAATCRVFRRCRETLWIVIQPRNLVQPRPNVARARG